MPVFAFEPLRVPSNLDKRRKRMAVWATPRGGGERVYLGDVWCSITSGEWRFAVGPGYVRSDEAYDTQDAAARALLAKRAQDAEALLGNDLMQANAFRLITGKPQLAVTEWEAVPPLGASPRPCPAPRPVEAAAATGAVPADDNRANGAPGERRGVTATR